MSRVRKAAVLGTLAGAFALAGCATLEESLAEETHDTYYATLTGAQEVGGGDRDGTGKAEITVSDNFDQVCWDLNDLANLDTVTAVHIHRGAAGTNGPPVFTLDRANEGGWKGCKSGGEWTQDRIEGNPQAFYVNVHTTAYPNGAIRGQLGK